MRHAPLLESLIAAMDGSMEPARGEALLAAFAERVFGRWTGGAAKAIRGALADVDRTLSKQLAVVMHHAAFKALEGSWRGIAHLVFRTETGESLKIKLLPAGRAELAQDFDARIDEGRSVLRRLLCDEPLEASGGEPFTALIADFVFTAAAEDVGLLQAMASVGEEAFCPLVAAAAPSMLLLGRVVDSPEHAEWRTFRDSPGSRFAVLTCPRVLARVPYGASTRPIDGFAFDEVADSDFVWMSSAYLMGANVARAFAEFGWCTKVCGVEHGGLVAELPVHRVEGEVGGVATARLVEVRIRAEEARSLSDLGLSPLVGLTGSSDLVFLDGQTCQKSKRYDTADASANAAIMARLPYVFAVSRLVHFMRAICRDRIGSFRDPADVETALLRWMDRYVTIDAKLGAEAKDRFPLASTQLRVQERPDAPGRYRVIMHVRPWLPMEELTTEPRVIATLPRRVS